MPWALLVKRFWPIGVAVAIVIAAFIAVYIIYNKGEKAGAAGVTNAVQADTIKKREDARISKEKTDAEVLSIPYNERVDGLR